MAKQIRAPQTIHIPGNHHTQLKASYLLFTALTTATQNIHGISIRTLNKQSTVGSHTQLMILNI